MAIIKCKMCGGDLNIVEDSSVCECEYCGTKQTVPKADDERKLKLFSRAGKLLRGCEFDKAAGVFESIVSDFPEEAEAYWGLILCKYGIEYVDDPATGKKIPTCHRSSFESVEDDTNFEQACENADAIARRVYREEARQIETLRMRILEVSGQEEPYDIFISYKELGEDGDRTTDSVIAQDIYKELTREGYRVFFSRISLEGKLGVEYEPYIFAALNSAKVMIVVGTDYEYFDAVWVKNEWSRFLKLIASGQKKTIIPVYKDMDPYDMPKELRSLAAQDMGKIGAMQDLLHGVEKLLGKTNTPPAPEQPVQQVNVSGGPNVMALLDRGNMALEDGEWDKAKEFFDQVLNMDSRCAEAYLGLAMADGKFSNREAFRAAYTAIKSTCREGRQITRAKKFAQLELAKWFTQLDADAETVKEEYALRQKAEEEARRARQKAEEEARLAKQKAEEEARLAKQKAEEEAKRKAEENFQSAVQCFKEAKTVSDYRQVLNDVKKLTGYTSEAYYYIRKCEQAISEIEAEQRIKDARLAKERMIEEGQKNGKEQLFQEACEAFTHAEGLEELTAIENRFRALKPYRDEECNDFIRKCELSKIIIQEKIEAEKEEKSRQRAAAFCSMIAAGRNYSFAVRTDGTVNVTKYNGKNDEGEGHVEAWRNIIAIAAGASHTVGLKADGTVVAEGNKKHGECNVASWKDIIAISAGEYFTIGLRSNGTVVATGNNTDGECNINTWEGIIAVTTGTRHTVGLKKDGTVLVTGRGKEEYNCSTWKDIVAIAAGDSFTAGLVANGTVVVSGSGVNIPYVLPGENVPHVSQWKDIIAIAADRLHLVGLKKDGTVEASIASNYLNKNYGQVDVMGWRNIVGVSTSIHHTLGLRSDGTVISTKEKDAQRISGKYATSGWKLFRDADSMEEERENYLVEHRQKIAELIDKRELLLQEFSRLKGPFSIKRRREIEARLAEIRTELNKLQ